MSIKLTDAAKYYTEAAHQSKAFDYLEASVPAKVLNRFAVLYRNDPGEAATANIITAEICHQLTGYEANTFDEVFVNDFNSLLAVTKFAEHELEMCMLIANFLHETCNFLYMKEIADGWAYEGRSDLGNVNRGDGPKFKGAGVLQLTGRYNYSKAAEKLGDQQILEQGVDYTANAYPFKSAWGWIEDNDLLNVCLTKGFDECCYRINGGWNGYEDRVTKYGICKRVFGVK